MRASGVRLWRWPAWVWLAAIAIVLLIRFPLHFISSPPYLMDFDVFRTVAARLAQGRAAELYAPTSSELMVFKYAPIWAAAWWPLAWLSPQAGAVVWSVGTVLWVTLACAVSLALARRAGWPAPGWLAAAAVGLLTRPITAEFLNGQTDALWVLLSALGWWAVSAQRRRAAAVSWAAAMTLKLPAALVLLWAARWRPALAGKTLAATVALALGGSALLQPSRPLALLQDWVAVLRESGPSRAFEIGNQTLLSLMGRFLTADRHGLHVAAWDVSAVTALALAAAGALALAALWTPRALRGRPEAAAFDGALLTCLMVLCSPTSWAATYTVLLVPLIIALAATLARGRAARRDPVALAGAALTLLCSLATHRAFWRALGIRQIRGETYVFEVVMVLPWMALVLFGWLAWLRASAVMPRTAAAAASRGTS
jgi:hypothetical protein